MYRCIGAALSGSMYALQSFAHHSQQADTRLKVLVARINQPMPIYTLPCVFLGISWHLSALWS